MLFISVIGTVNSLIYGPTLFHLNFNFVFYVYSFRGKFVVLVLNFIVYGLALFFSNSQQPLLSALPSNSIFRCIS